MQTDKMPTPVIAAQPMPNVIRQAFEECQNALDARPEFRSVTEEFPIPQGVAVVRCARSRTHPADVTVTIRMAPQARTETEALIHRS